MRTFTKKILTLALIGSFVMAQTVLAQSVPDASTTAVSAPDTTTTPSVDTLSAPSDATMPQITDAAAQTSDIIDASSTPSATATDTPEVSSTSQQPVDLQGSTASVQDTANTQSAASSTVLENTTNPENASSTDATVIPVVEATTSTSSEQSVSVPQDQGPATPIVEGTSTADAVVAQVDASTQTTEAVPVVPQPAPEKSAGVLLPDVPPLPTYSFALTGKKIPSQRKVENKNGDVVGEEAVATPLTSHVDNATGEVTVSGQCSDAYFVVLLFKNADDYANDPRSYIVNRAYPCVGGAFSYSIADLPSTLPNGNYYLLVGQEGKTGTWTPITELTEIAITKNQ